ncbi:MAG TPA: hypothetical protein VED24_01790 [Candidatus Acidoferrum sp.]|nr:hypothetical protein [Candidatus Acidoferrum sp.]
MADDFEIGYDIDSGTWAVRIAKRGEPPRATNDWIQEDLRSPTEVAEFILGRIAVSDAQEKSRIRKRWVEEARGTRQAVYRFHSRWHQSEPELDALEKTAIEDHTP